MSFVAKCLIVAPVCAALVTPFGYARAENPAVDGSAKSRVENVVTRSIGIKDAQGGQVRATDIKVSARPADGATGAAQAKAPAPAQVLTNPELPVAPLDNYRLEIGN